jgi:hypothetical protein
MSVISVIREAETGESWFKANLGLKKANSCLKEQAEHRGAHL